jgi:NitT/TauT family transport system permease protein
MVSVYRYRYPFLALSGVVYILFWWLVWYLVDYPPRPGGLPSPLDTVSGFAQIFSDPQIGSLFVTSVGTTLTSVAEGFALAAVVGVPIGILMGRYLLLDYALDPQVNIWYSLPAVAFVPLVMPIFGETSTATMIVAFLIALFSVVINVYTGVKNISKSVVETAYSFGCSQLQLLTKVIIPESLPNMMLGLRLAITRSLEGVVVAELIISAVGIGGMIFDTTDKLQMGLSVALIMILAVISIALNEGMKYLNRRVVFWKESAAMTRR